MALQFTGTDALVRDSAVLTSYPFSVSLLVNTHTNFRPFWTQFANHPLNEGASIEIGGALVVNAQGNDEDGSNFSASAGSAIAADTWTQVGGYFLSNSSRTVIQSGVKGTVDTTTVAPTAAAACTGLMCVYRGSGHSSPFAFMPGIIAEYAVWNRDLTSGEWLALQGSGGVFGNPQNIPSGLVEYGSFRTSTTLEIGAAFTVTGTSIVTHPSVAPLTVVFPNRWALLGPLLAQ